MVASASSTDLVMTLRWNTAASRPRAPIAWAAATSSMLANRPRMKINWADGSASLTCLTSASLATKLAMASAMATMPLRLAEGEDVAMDPR